MRRVHANMADGDCAPKTTTASAASNAHGRSRKDTRPACFEGCRGPVERPYTYCLGVSGWLFCYYFGVVKQLKEHNMHAGCRVVGSSGGALAGLFLIEELDCEEMISFVMRCAEHARSHWMGPFFLKEYCLEAHRLFVGENTHKVCGDGRVSVSMTSLPWFSNVRVSDYQSAEHFLEVMLATSHLVPLSGILPVHVQGVGWCIDGGMSDLQLCNGIIGNETFNRIHCWRETRSWIQRRRKKRQTRERGTDADRDEGPTVSTEQGPGASASSESINICSISPFYFSRASIKPSRWVPPWWAFYPPSPEQLRELYALGQQDALAWIREQRRLARGGPFPGPRHPADNVREGGEEEVGEGGDFGHQAWGGPAGYSGNQVEDDGSSHSIEPLSWLPRVLIRGIGFNLVYAELFVQSVISFLVYMLQFLSSPFYALAARDSWSRFKSASTTLLSPRLYLCAVPEAVSWIGYDREQLRRLSVVFRILEHMLL